MVVRGPSRPIAVILTLVAALVSGCMRSTTVIAVSEDGTGTAELVVAADAAALSQFASGTLAATVTEPDASTTVVPEALVCSQTATLVNAEQLPPGAVTEPYEADGLCGQRVTFPFTSGQELAAGLAGVLGADPSVTAAVVLRREADGWYFETPVVSFDDTAAAETAGLPPGAAQAILTQAEVTYQVTLPGQPIAGGHNADRLDGSTFAWDIDLANPRAKLFAQTGVATVTEQRDLRLVVAAAVGGLVLLAIAIGLIVTRRRQSALAGYQLDVDPMELPGRGGGHDWSRAATPDEPIVAEPFWDDELQAWVADHPIDGWLILDERTGEWEPY